MWSARRGQPSSCARLLTRASSTCPGPATWWPATATTPSARPYSNSCATCAAPARPPAERTEGEMQIGIQIPDFTWPGGPAALRAKLAEIGRAVDAGGFASLWVMDHWFQIPIVGPAGHAMLDGYGALHYLAAVTERVELGTLVTGVTYRHPGLLIKTVSSLDVLSGGRAWLGIGAAWFEREHRGL